MEKKLSACTTVLVGKQATIDGSTMAARNDDTYGPLTPQRFVVYPTYKGHPNQVKSYLNHFVGDRPANGARYQGVPNVNLTTEGVYDENDVWYMEIVTGHHWVAQRIPDDAYAVTGNRVAIQEVDFDDPANFMWSDGIQEFVADHHLNPDLSGWNFRRIFGTATVFDQHYNTPRQWYGHLVLSPDVKLDPLDFDLPFVLKADHKITLEEVEQVLSSHYQGTVYDPLGHEGTEQEKRLFRPISLNRTQNSHVLQVRNDLPEAASTIMWMSFGIPTFTPYVPFFGNADEVDASYRNTPKEMNVDFKSAYWMYRALSMLVEAHHAEFLQDDLDYLKDAREYFHRFVDEVAPLVDGMTNQEATAILSAKNQELVAEMAKRTKDLMAKLMMKGLELSKLTFTMDKNL